MALTYIAFAAIGIFTAAVVAIGAIVVMEPLYRPPFEPSDWIMTVFAGIAAVLAGTAGIAVGTRAADLNALSWTQIIIGAIVAVVGIVLTVIGIWIYEPSGDDQPA